MKRAAHKTRSILEIFRCLRYKVVWFISTWPEAVEHHTRWVQELWINLFVRQYQGYNRHHIVNSWSKSSDNWRGQRERDIRCSIALIVKKDNGVEKKDHWRCPIYFSFYAVLHWGLTLLCQHQCYFKRYNNKLKREEEMKRIHLLAW